MRSTHTHMRLSAIWTTVFLLSLAAGGSNGADKVEDAGLAGVLAPPGAPLELWAHAPQVVHPLGLDFDSRGRAWILDSNTSGSGRILIFETRSAQGAPPAPRLFADGIERATGLAVARGGVIVGAAPRLLFLADSDADDKADGPPGTLLDGFEVVPFPSSLHSFAWGPDGWLYGLHSGMRTAPPGPAFQGGLWRLDLDRRLCEPVMSAAPGVRCIQFDDSGRPRLRVLGSGGADAPELAGVSLGNDVEWTAARVGPDGTLICLDGDLGWGCGEGGNGRVIALRASTSTRSALAAFPLEKDPAEEFAPRVSECDAASQPLLLRSWAQSRDPAEARHFLQSLLRPAWSDRLRWAALWTLWKTGGLDEDSALEALSDSSAAVRAAALRLVASDLQVSSKVLESIVRLAGREMGPGERREVEGLVQQWASGDRDRVHSAALVARVARSPRRDRITARDLVLSGDERALRSESRFVLTQEGPNEELLMALDTIALADPQRAVAELSGLWKESAREECRSAILDRLAQFLGAPLGELVVDSWSKLSPGLRSHAVMAVATRENWALSLLEAVRSRKILAEEISSEDAARLWTFGSPRTRSALEQVWGRFADVTSAEIERRIDRLASALASRRGSFQRGARVFEQRCSKCHELYGKGHRVGPRLDTFPRGDTTRLLRSIVNPNAEIRKEYLATSVLLRDGRFIQGILTAETSETISLLKEEGVLQLLHRSEVNKLVASGVSLMPEGLTNDLEESAVQDLAAYLTSRPMVTDFLLAGPFHSSAENPLERELPPELDPGPRLEEPVAWSRIVAAPSGLLEASELRLCKPGDVVYLVAQVSISEATTADLLVSCSMPMRVWIAGMKVFERAAEVPAAAGGLRIPVMLPEGQVAILVKLARARDLPRFLLRWEDPGRKIALSGQD